MPATDDFTGFTAQFKGLPLNTRRRKERAQRERRASLTEKQRHPGGKRAVRTTQMNFRCSPDFKELTKTLAAQLDCSVADLLEDAVKLLAQKKKLSGGGH